MIKGTVIVVINQSTVRQSGATDTMLHCLKKPLLDGLYTVIVNGVQWIPDNDGVLSCERTSALYNVRYVSGSFKT